MKVYGGARLQPHELINGDVKKSPRISLLKRDLDKHSSSESLLNLLDSSIERQEINYDLISSQKKIIMEDLLEVPNKKKQKHHSKKCSDAPVIKTRDSSTETIKSANDEGVDLKKILYHVLDTDNESPKKKKKHKHHDVNNSTDDVGTTEKKHRKKHLSDTSVELNEDTLLMHEELPKKHKKKNKHKNETNEKCNEYVNNDKIKKSKHKDIGDFSAELSALKLLKKQHKDLSASEDDRYDTEAKTGGEIVKKHKKSKNKHRDLSLSEAESHTNDEQNKDVSEHKKSKKKHKKSSISEEGSNINYGDSEELNRKYKDLSVMQMQEGELELVADEKKVKEGIDNTALESHQIKKKKKHKKEKDVDRNDSDKSKMENQSIKVPKKDTDNNIDRKLSEDKLKSPTKKKSKIKLEDSVDNALQNKLRRLCDRLTSSPDVSRKDIDEDSSKKTKVESEENNKMVDSGVSDSETNNKSASETDEEHAAKQIIKYKIKHKKSPLKQVEAEKNDGSSNDNILKRINESLDSLQGTMLDDSEIEELLKLDIMEPWTIPPAHRIETRVSSHPTKEQQKMFKDLNTKLRTGPYTKEEDNKIKENWTQFCKNHQLKPNPLLFFPQNCAARNILPVIQRIKFVRCLGKDLGNRTLYSIYCRFLILFRENKKGRFTDEEDNTILIYSQHADIPNRFSILATILNRSRMCVKKRYDVLTNVATSELRVKWDRDLMQKFVRNLLDATKVENINELKEFNIEMKHWKKIENKMGIPVQKLRSKWTADMYPRFFLEEEDLVLIQRNLIQKLYDRHETDRKEVNWNEVAKDFPGVPGIKLNKLFTELVRRYVPVLLKDDFKACLQLLKDVFDNLPDKKIKPFVTKLVYVDNVLYEESVRKNKSRLTI